MGKIVTEKRPKKYKIMKTAKPLPERKKMVWGTVKQMYWAKAQAEITLLIQKYR